MRLIALDADVVEGELVDLADTGIEPERGQGHRAAAELKLRLLDMIQIKMCVAQGVHKVAGLEPGDLRDHRRQKRVGGDVKGQPQKDIGAALVELAAQPPLAHVELKKRVAG